MSMRSRDTALTGLAVLSVRPLRIAMIGTRGVPARYGGFETAVEEVGARLVDRGHEVTVYCRRGNSELTSHRGMVLVHLPAVHAKSAETLSHSALSVLHQQLRPADVAILFKRRQRAAGTASAAAARRHRCSRRWAR
jgi:Domain of unknown function (DUF1972)